jgi:hypothetical protein
VKKRSRALLLSPWLGHEMQGQEHKSKERKRMTVRTTHAAERPAGILLVLLVVVYQEALAE